jgi:hypothetical protein
LREESGCEEDTSSDDEWDPAQEQDEEDEEDEQDERNQGLKGGFGENTPFISLCEMLPPRRYNVVFCFGCFPFGMAALLWRF